MYIQRIDRNLNIVVTFDAHSIVTIPASITLTGPSATTT